MRFCGNSSLRDDKVETCKNFTRNFIAGKIKAPNGGLWGAIKGVLATAFGALIPSFFVYAIISRLIESPIIKNIVIGVILVIVAVLIFFALVGGKAEGKETKQLNKEIANYPEF